MRWATPLCLSVAVLEGLEVQIAGVTGQKIAAHFALDYRTLGIFFSASTFGLFFGALAGGWLADRLGRARVLILSVLLFGIGTFSTGLAWDSQSLIVLRGLTGIGLGSALPCLLAITAEAAPADKPKRNIAWLYSAVPMGGVVASFLAMSLQNDWRLIYYIAGTLPIVMAFVMTALWWENIIAGPQVQAAETKAPAASLSPLTVFFSQGRAIPSLLLWSSFAATLLVLYLILSWLPILLGKQNLSVTMALSGQIFFNIGGSIACIAIAPYLDSHRALPIMVVSFLLVPVLLFSLAIADNAMLSIAIAALLGSVTLATQSILYGAAATIYPPHMRATGIGAAVAYGRIGSIMGPYLGALLLSMRGSQNDVLLATAGISLLGGAMAIALILHVSRSKSV